MKELIIYIKVSFDRMDANDAEDDNLETGAEHK
jgi:hypothetical protein